MNKLLKLWGLVLLLIFSQVEAKPEKIKQYGSIHAGGFAGSRSWAFATGDETIQDFGEKILLAKIEYNIRINSSIDGFFDFRGDLNDFGVKMHEVGVALKLSRDLQFSVGNLKRSFGLEEIRSKEDLLFIRRSLLHQYLSSFRVMNRNFTFRTACRPKGEMNRRPRATLNLAADGNIRILENLRLEFSGGNKTFGISEILGLHEFVYHPIGALGIDFSMASKPWTLEWEVVGGNDPVASDYSDIVGDSLNIWYGASRLAFAYLHLLKWESLKGLQFALNTSLIGIDQSDRIKWRTQVVPGVNLVLDDKGKIRWMTNAELYFSSSILNDQWHRQEYWIATQIQVKW